MDPREIEVTLDPAGFCGQGLGDGILVAVGAFAEQARRYLAAQYPTAAITVRVASNWPEPPIQIETDAFNEALIPVIRAELRALWQARV